MTPTVKAILTVLSRAQLAGRGTLTAADVETLEQLAKSHDALLEALEALGTQPEPGYCFCRTQEQANRGHTGECRDARAAIARAERDQ